MKAWNALVIAALRGDKDAVAIIDAIGDAQDREVHRCARYLNARGEVIDPADQDGLGCPVCWPPDGRWHRLEAEALAP